MTGAEQTHWIGERARARGFDLCGVAPVTRQNPGTATVPGTDSAESFPELDRLPEWLARGYGGEMNYLHDPRRTDPRRVLEGARSLIVVALNYNSQPQSVVSPEDADDQSPRGWISRYAWGDDYHDVIQQKLQELISDMRAEFAEPFAARAYSDTGPIIERVAAKYAGLGWLGKNTCLINSQLGSWLFLGVIVTTLALEPSVAPGLPAPDLCGTCTRCLDACPTQAFPQPYVLDARRCISYLTVELRTEIPEEIRPQMGNAVIGCDICQDVCPWNRKAPVTTLAAFQPRDLPMAQSGKENIETGENESQPAATLFAPELEWLASLTQQEFSSIFRGCAVKRAKWRGLVRNACVALGNSKILRDSATYPRVLALLENLAGGSDPPISEHAQWAISRLKN